MFGIGFTELLLISVIAILFLGPDKLPSALMEMAKFIKSVKKTIGDAKSSLEEEMKISDLKEEALNYKKTLDATTDDLRGFKNLSLESFDDIIEDEPTSSPSPKAEEKKHNATFAQAPKERGVPEEAITATRTAPTEESTPSDTKPKKDDA